MDVLFEIEPKDLTLEELAKQEAEAVAKLEKLRSAITEAQTKKRRIRRRFC
jgi:multidrug resistance efflux pump